MWLYELLLIRSSPCSVDMTAEHGGYLMIYDETLGSFLSRCVFACSMTKQFGMALCFGKMNELISFPNQIDWFLLIQPFIKPYLTFLISVHCLCN